MKIVSIHTQGREQAALKIGEKIVPLGHINLKWDFSWTTDPLELIRNDLAKLKHWYAGLSDDSLLAVSELALKVGDFTFSPLYRQPGKIWGIGLNYAAHAGDLDEKPPQKYPASFMKPLNTLIGYGDVVVIPRLSERTTGEAELGVVIGKTARNVKEEDWLDYVAGFVAIIDMTAEDILRENPRYLTLVKSFDTFFSLGPELLTPDEIGDLENLQVSTYINGKEHASNRIARMTFSPARLLAFHSQVMPLEPGDIISTGTPGAAPLADGDLIECRIPGFMKLVNPVKDAKKTEE